RSFAVYFGSVLLNHFRVIADQPLPAYREAAKALAFRDAGLFQQWQRAAAGSYEYEPGGNRPLDTGSGVPYRNVPAPVLALRNVAYLVGGVDGYAVLFPQVIAKAAGKRAKVHVRTGLHAGSGYLLGRVAA